MLQGTGGGVSSGERMGLEMVKQFCYLGDVLDVEGGVDGAVRARISSAWKRFRELQRILIMRKLSLNVSGKVSTSCVRSVMVYGSETWAVKAEQVKKFERTEMRMVTWI